MNLYKISQRENCGYDTYDSAVVAAPDVETARNINPDGRGQVKWDKVYHYGDWATKPEKVNVVFIGVADINVEEGVIVASFNAG